jgi:hypothetical protein
VTSTATTPATPGAPGAATPARRLDVEFLFLDLDTCGRCTSTDATLTAALEIVDPTLRAMGVTVALDRQLVADEAVARELGFVSSPTIRINGEDIAGALVESQCDACTDACGCNGSILCRDWLYRGKRYTQPPVGLIVEALMTRASQDLAGERPTRRTRHQPVDLPENLRRFFACKAGQGAVEAVACCDAAEQATCCEPSAKSSCCPAGAADPAECGCR